MLYSEAEFCQGVIVAVMVCLLVLRLIMKRRDQPESAAKPRKIPQEHDERFS